MSATVYNSPAMMDVFARIAQERHRQNTLFVEGHISFNCSSRVVDPHRKLRVLVEEVGEVARELENLENNTGYATEKKIRQCLVNELTQVAAVAVAWLEALTDGGAK